MKKVNFDVDEPVLNTLDIIAEKNNISRAELFRIIIKDFLDRKQIPVPENKKIKIDHGWFEKQSKK